MPKAHITPPTAQRIPVKLERHGHTRTDDYYWLNQRDDPAVMAYLKAENAYTDALMAHTTGLQQTLFEEIKGRIPQTDATVPYRKGDYLYYTRFEEGQEYPVYCRKPATPDAPEQVLLDVNQLAPGHGFFSIGPLAVSSGQDLLAYPVDTVGRRVYTIYIKDLTTGEMLPDVIPDITPNLAWAEDNRTLFYTRQDPVTLRWHRVYRHRLGADPAQDPLVHEETDETFRCFVQKSKSERYLLIGSHQILATEFRTLAADDPEGEFRLFAPRERDHQYWVDHFGDHFFIRTNHQARNFRLMQTPMGQTGREHWQELLPHRDDVLLESFELFRDHLVVQERHNALTRLRVHPWSGGPDHHVTFDEPAYLVRASDNHELDTPLLRFTYTSLTTPESTFDYHMDTRERTLLKQDTVGDGFDAGNYQTERLWASADDGARIPISIVYRKGLPRDGSRPLLLYGYGSYGFSRNPIFSPERVSLLDRGFSYAIAHIRGGQELGRAWYEDGKLLQKKNTFTDFVACAEHLVAHGYTRPDRLFALGASAGGLLMGAILNMRPDLFQGVVADVPFVDVVTTMLDETIPLTTFEYDEWGDPNDPTYYEYMLSYSPYDNVAARDYPNLLVLTSLHDSQVQYWEPAKWVAKLRALKTGANRLLLRTQMEAGHGGVSGRTKGYEETAFTYGFLLDLVGIEE